MFPDAEGWENMDPDEVGKWSVGSEFPPDASQHSQTEVGGMVNTNLLTTRSDIHCFVYEYFHAAGPFFHLLQ